MAPWLLLHDLSSHNVAFNAKAVPQCVQCAFVDLIFSAYSGSKSLITFDYKHETFF